MEDYKRIIYVDMDGVLADFDRGFYEIAGISTDSISIDELWARIDAYDKAKFFSELPWMCGGKEMWNFITENFLDVKILSALGKSDKIDKTDYSRKDCLVTTSLAFFTFKRYHSSR